jgi:hypothetical protein
VAWCSFFQKKNCADGNDTSSSILLLVLVLKMATKSSSHMTHERKHMSDHFK